MRAILPSGAGNGKRVPHFPLKYKSVIVMRMTPEERSLLERTASLAEENNQMLRSIRRSSRISLAMRIGYWVLILLVSFGAYYFIQPYVQTMAGLIGGDPEASSQGSQSSLELLQDLLR
jgi:hypothetical protein